MENNSSLYEVTKPQSWRQLHTVESYWNQFAVWKSYSKCDLMTGAFNMHVLKIARSSYKRLNSQLVHSRWITWWTHKKPCPSEQTQNASSTNMSTSEMALGSFVVFVNAVLLFWSLCDPTWLFELNKWLIYLIKMTQNRSSTSNPQ